MRNLLTAFMLLFAVCGVQAQQGKLSRAAIDSIRALGSMREGGSVLHFTKSRVDMGAMYESDTARTFSLFFENSSERSIAIGKVTSSCGCASVKYDTASVPPRGKGRIDVRFSPKGKAGTVDTDIFVYLSDGNMPDAKLVLLGNVIGEDEWEHLPQSMGRLKIKSRKVDFGKVIRTQRRTERIACANAGVRPLKISAIVKPQYVTLSTDPEVIEPGEEGDILVTIDAGRISARTGEQRFKVIIEGVEGAPSTRTIEGVFYISDDNE